MMVDEVTIEPAERASSARDVERAIARAAEALRARQAPDGAYRSRADIGPLGVALAVLAEAWLGVLTPSDAKAAARALRRRQAKDGGFVVHPVAAETSLGATGVCRAALRACGVPDDAPSVRAAEARIAALGGYRAIAEGLRERAEPAAIFCVMEGLLPADVLPPLSPDAAALPWSERMLDGRVHAGVPMLAYAMAAVRERHRRGSVLPRFLRAPTRALARARLAAYMAQFQNADGSWNGAVFSTALALVALEGVGVGVDDPMVERGLAWLESRKDRCGGSLEIRIFDADVWETSYAMMALHASGVASDDPAQQAAARHLLEAQCRAPQPRVNQPDARAPRTHGWAFARGNDTMPDCDDTAVALAALGALGRAGAPRELHVAMDRAVAWLRGMQNPGGGWGSYVHGLPDREPGAPLFAPTPRPFAEPRALVELVLAPPPELGDPACADLVGRVLLGLAACGLDVDDPMVARAVEFLERDARPDGSFFGLWNPAYVSGTAFALLGLAEVGYPAGSPLVARAVRWLLGVQNRDGGWGEAPDSFVDPSRAGRAPSMPPLTGIVLAAFAALRDRGACDPAMERAGGRAVRYLVRAQRPDGDWPNQGFALTIVPPIFYVLEHHTLFYTLYGLARFGAVPARGGRRARRARAVELRVAAE